MVVDDNACSVPWPVIGQGAGRLVVDEVVPVDQAERRHRTEEAAPSRHHGRAAGRVGAGGGRPDPVVVIAAGQPSPFTRPRFEVAGDSRG
mgnify:CR=1 FL=1